MKRYGRYKNQGMGLTIVVVVILLAVFSGYMGTRYIIEPYILGGGFQLGGSGRADEGGEAGEEGLTGTNGNDIVSGEQNVTDLTQTGIGGGDSGATAGDGAADTDGVVNLQEQVQPQTDDSAAAQDSGQTGGTTETSVTGSVGGSLYCIQFGSFTTKEAADNAVQELAVKNVSSYVLQKDDSFKVLSVPYEGKETADAAAAALRETVGDVYVVAM